MNEFKLGVVVIGRNEGERLRRCLNSILQIVPATVYVDSGSNDGSTQMAIEMGADVVDLDLSQPFTAARARNEGLRRLLLLYPDIAFVQFLDGDCELVPGWLEAARVFLMDHPSHAAVCGRLRERHPERSVYNRLCDEEWNTPIGEALYCGGATMMRVSALQALGGFRENMIAGEEPELCVRLRQKGWRIQRIDREMALHDAAITRFSQWWKRTVRGGHAFAEGAWLHGAPPERHWVRETGRAVLWGLLLPLCIMVLGLFVDPRAAWLALAYPLQWLRLSIRDHTPAMAFFTLAGKFAEAQGVLKFGMNKLLGRGGRLIEYK